MKDSTVLFNSHLNLSGYPKARILHILQGDRTELEFELKDKNGETIELNETTGQVQIVESETDEIKAVTDAEVNEGKAKFIIDTILPVGDYELYLKIGEYYFPSSTQSFVLKVEKAYDVTDIDVSDLTTIDIVVDGLRDDVLQTISSELEAHVNYLVENDPDKFRGEKGEPFRFQDFTDDQLAQITPEAPEPVRPENMTTEELDLIRGHSAYQVAVQEGYQGTEDEWLESLNGEDGEKGEPGLSAYSEAVNMGFSGTKEDWLDSLKGEKGDRGQDGTVSFNDLTEEQIAMLRIPPKFYTREEFETLTEIDPHIIYIIDESEYDD